MTEASAKKQTVLEAFLKQREKRQNDTGIQAQKLVNLYRHLALFGDDFLATYNKMLLDSSPEVQMALADIMGGMIVRQYLDFLKTKQQPGKEDFDADEVASYATEVSYLPDPDEIEPYHPVSGVVSTVPVSMDSKAVNSSLNDAVLKSQGAFLEQALSKQTSFLQQALGQMQDSLAKQQENLTKQLHAVPVVQSEKQENNPDMSSLFDQVLQKQNQALIDSLKQVFDNAAEVTAKQMQTFEQVLKSNIGEKKSYPEIEEYHSEPSVYAPETVYIMPETLENQPVPPRARHVEEEMDMPDGLEQSDMVETKQNRSKKTTVLPDEDVEILSEIDLPTEPL